MRFFRFLLVCGLLVAAACSVWAVVSAADAVSFVETENSFLKKNEQLETPTVPVLHDAKKYWMIPLLSGEGIATYFPVSFADKTLSENQAVNSQLFSTVQFLRDYLSYRNKLVQQNKQFFIGRDNQLIIDNLSSSLQSEVYELNIIKKDLKGQQQQSLLSGMQSSLNRMSTIAADLSQKIGTGVEAESSFTNEPDSKNLGTIRDSFGAAFSQLYALEQEARAYEEDKVPRLKGFIANSDLALDQKTQFLAYSNPPESMKTIGSNSIGNWVILSQETEQTISQWLNKAKSKDFLDSLELELEKRIKRNRAYSAIFSNDPDFSKQTGFPSLKMAMDDLQSAEKKPLWQNQQQLAIAIQQYNNAAQLLDSEQFDLSVVASQKAKIAAIAVKKSGLVQEEPGQFDASLWIEIAIMGLIALIILYFLKNRNKIIGAVAPQEESAGVEAYGWQKR